jgi:O-antigen/teichoic acid export membrane protein
MVLNPANGLYLTPIMNRNIEKWEKIKAALEFEKKLAIVLILAAVPVVLFPELLLTVLFSTEFTVAARFVFLFVFAQCISQLAGVHQALLIGFDDLKVYSLITCTGHICLGILAWFLIPPLGIFGAALGFIAGYLIIFVLTLLRLRIKHQFIMPRQLSVLIIYGLSMLLITGAVFTQYNPWNGVVITTKIGIGLLFVCSLLFYLSKEERDYLFGLLGRIQFSRILGV